MSGPGGRRVSPGGRDDRGQGTRRVNTGRSNGRGRRTNRREKTRGRNWGPRTDHGRGAGHPRRKPRALERPRGGDGGRRRSERQGRVDTRHSIVEHGRDPGGGNSDAGRSRNEGRTRPVVSGARQHESGQGTRRVPQRGPHGGRRAGGKVDENNRTRRHHKTSRARMN